MESGKSHSLWWYLSKSETHGIPFSQSTDIWLHPAQPASNLRFQRLIWGFEDMMVWILAPPLTHLTVGEILTLSELQLPPLSPLLWIKLQEKCQAPNAAPGTQSEERKERGSVWHTVGAQWGTVAVTNGIRGCFFSEPTPTFGSFCLFISTSTTD